MGRGDDEAGDLQEIFQQAKEGDRAAQAELFQRFQAAFHRIVHAKLGQRLRREDSTQGICASIFLDLFFEGKLGRFEGPFNEPAFLGWLALLADRKLRDKWRRAERGPDFVGLDSETMDTREPPPFDPASLADALRRVETLLSPDEARAVILRVIQGKSYREIAGTLGKMTESAARSLYHRARNKLRELW